MERLDADAAQGRPFSVFETQLAGEPYQVVARLFYQDAFRERPVGLVGFTVNLRWARGEYFPDFARQMARIGSGFAVAIVDGAGRLVAGTITPSAERADRASMVPADVLRPGAHRAGRLAGALARVLGRADGRPQRRRAQRRRSPASNRTLLRPPWRRRCCSSAWC